MNMAIDQAIMEAVAVGRVPPTLRFFAWEPACLSLGYMQPVQDVDRPRLTMAGWDIVRRMTGGRAILHTDELTYSVALPADDPLVAGGIVDSYRRLSAALVEGLRLLGVAPEADKRADGHHSASGPVCFEVPSHYEITVSGKKLIGSAQVRRFGAVLQHGTLPLWGDITRICQVLVFASEEERQSARQRVAERAITLEQALGRLVPWQEAAAAMSEGFRRVFDLDVQQAALTADEYERAVELRTTQYATESWNARL
jgi:lipoate-protein ligase A